ncbi:hypothetical protein HHI36_019449 [Cryptolaemus montrouzieri]|uniref:Protein LLP homolog n=1 Tax=Cryptolaemus montrouzieri TaxID=559131 RepID=A0ABD2P3S0_9CUCU
MAKSLRSKWRRKCRAVKRIRYGQKELERLKSILGVDDTNNTVEKIEKTEISDIVQVKTIDEIKKQDENNVAETMEVDASSSKFNVKTLRDKNGTYPIWLHPRKIPKRGKREKKNKMKKQKRKK